MLCERRKNLVGPLSLAWPSFGRMGEEKLNFTLHTWNFVFERPELTKRWPFDGVRDVKLKWQGTPDTSIGWEESIETDWCSWWCSLWCDVCCEVIFEYSKPPKVQPSRSLSQSVSRQWHRCVTKGVPSQFYCASDPSPALPLSLSFSLPNFVHRSSCLHFCTQQPEGPLALSFLHSQALLF